MIVGLMYYINDSIIKPRQFTKIVLVYQRAILKLQVVEYNIT